MRTKSVKVVAYMSMFVWLSVGDFENPKQDNELFSQSLCLSSITIVAYVRFVSDFIAYLCSISIGDIWEESAQIVSILNRVVERTKQGRGQKEKKKKERKAKRIQSVGMIVFCTIS